jgi:GT2 family glycosyltransferase
MNWTIVTATNNESVLRSCLLGSPDIRCADRVMQQKGFSSAARAYNAALAQGETDIFVLVHQDVYLPAGWTKQLGQAIAQLEKQDPQWAVAGVWGVKENGERAGNVYCTGLGRMLGQSGTDPVQVRTLDEVLLVVRKSSGVTFDEQLPGYHLYGTDICLEAQRRGLRCYALPAFCIHNTNGYALLPWEFWKSYLIMRRKWKEVLPVITPCAEITKRCWPMFRWNAVQAVNLMLKRHKVGKRISDPAQLYQELVAAGKVCPVAAGN